jgi:radical SAM superfamily enzyme YgiQ (UPF0313 family)
MVYDGIVKSKNRLAREQGTVIKDWGGRLPFALVYPNSYYLGMSNLGIQAIYRLLNGHDKIVAERVFWEDEEPLSVESIRPLTDFAVAAFSLSYELDYFNVIRVLKEAGIPLRTADRDERYPLVIAGGPCVTANPIPLAPFFDAVCIGEAEAVLPAMIPVIEEGITGSREELLRALAGLPGVFVPEYPPAGKVVRQYAADLDAFPVASTVLTPDTELGDLYLIEAERGCPWSCRFCLVSQSFSPGRFRSVEGILAQAEAGLPYRRRIGLVGPVVSAHPRIEEILAGINRLGTGLSISSMRLKPLDPAVLRELAAGGVRTITLAPEAGSERLRRVINKGVNEDDVLAAAELAAAYGFRQVKLYFMLGLPTETEDDVAAITDLSLKVKTVLDRRGAGGKLSLNIAPFIPKAGTPFQWLPMAPVKELEARLARLKKALRVRGIALKSESPAWSQVQAVLSRGDSRLAGVLEGMEKWSLAAWRRVVKEHWLDIEYWAHGNWDTSAGLPWSVIDTGTEPDDLERELTAALAIAGK